MLGVRKLGAAVVLSLVCSSPVMAQDPSAVSVQIAAEGLQATERTLAAKDDPSPNDLFTLGGVRFLRAIESTLQQRWAVGANEVPGIPILRLPIPPNMSPEPYRAEMVAEVFASALADLEAADHALAAIPEGAEIGVNIDLAALWFDINANGSREEGEDLFATSGSVLSLPNRAKTLTVRFDTADVAWLRAYAHLLSGISQAVLAYDPTETIRTVTEASEQLGPNVYIGMDNIVDQITIVLVALRQQPDATRTRAALAHFETMVAQNKVFWQAVSEETDNEAEWIPNPKQTSAFGVAVTQEVAESWQEILAEGESILKGETVLPYWRTNEGAPLPKKIGDPLHRVTGRGINVRKLFEEPAPVDAVLWFQGAGALPYLEEGRLANGRNWSQFFRLLGGEAPLYALWFN